MYSMAQQNIRAGAEILKLIGLMGEWDDLYNASDLSTR